MRFGLNGGIIWADWQCGLGRLAMRIGQIGNADWACKQNQPALTTNAIIVVS